MLAICFKKRLQIDLPSPSLSVWSEFADLAEFTQEQEDAAYSAAEQAVEHARRNGATELDLSEYVDAKSGSQIVRPFSALKRLPPETSTLTELRQLVLIGTDVSDLTPLAGLSGLRHLIANESPVIRLEPLSELHDLEHLSLDRTQVSDLSILRSLNSLQALSFDETRVSDLSPLAALTRLQTLSFDSTGVTDLSPLVDLGGLESLSFNETYVDDLSPIAGLSNLERLWLESGPINLLERRLAA